MHTKLDLVKKVWAASSEVRDWYGNGEQPTSIDDFTSANVRAYGLDGMGNTADYILADGVEAGIISADDIETMEF